jgi:type II secretion system protein L
MMAILIIRLYEDHSKELLRYSDDGVFESSSALASFSDIEHDHKLIILLPGFNVNILSVTLPNMSVNELQQAVPNFLEEQLSEDISELYFSIGDANESGKRQVAVMQQAKWDALLVDLKESELSPDLVLPDFLSLPIHEDSWTIFCNHTEALVRFGKQNGFSCDPELLDTLVQLKLKEAAEAPDKVELICDPDVTMPQLQLASGANTQTGSLAESINPNELLEQPPFNMLQKQFRTKRRKTAQRSYWYWCGVSFATLIAVFFIGQVALYIDFKIESHSLNKKTLAAYQRVFPGSTQLVEPKFRVEEQLKEYELTPNPFISIVERIGKVKKNNSDIILKSLNYTNNKATLVIIANSNAELNQFNQQLSHAGLKIISNQTSVINKKINETLVVEIV